MAVSEETVAAAAAAAALNEAAGGLSVASTDLGRQLALGEMNQAAAAYRKVEQLAEGMYAPLSQLWLHFQPE